MTNIIMIDAGIVETLKQQRDAKQALVETHEATIAERDARIAELEQRLADVARYARSIGHERIAQECERLPFEDAGQESDHAPAELDDNSPPSDWWIPSRELNKP